MPRKTLFLATLALLSGCALPRKWELPSEKVQVNPPAVWLEAGKGQNRKIATGWLSEFGDPRMNSLVQEAIRNNNNLKASAHRLRATRESTIIGRAARLPSLNAAASTSRRYTGLGPAPGFSSDSYGLSFSASWEIDLWGRLRDLDYATRADYESTLADFRGAQLSLAVNTAQAWINLTTAAQQLAIAERTLGDFQVSLRLIDRQYRAAVLRAVDVQLGRNNVAAAERNLRSRRLQRDEAARSLELLLGRYPAGELKSALRLPTNLKDLSTAKLLEQILSALPSMNEEIPAGLPSELLNRRPDLVASRLRVYSSARLADAARKDLLPSLRLTGTANTGSDQLKRALDPAYLTWSIASSLAQTIYQGGAPTARARAALQRNKAAVADYVQDVLVAFREIESALQTERSLREQEFFLLKEVEQASLAEMQSERDLRRGLEGASVLEILEAQRRAVNARGNLINLRSQRLLNRLDLHLALGGDYQTLGN
ncbi:MAG: efflux transporter outer membrane subunit [Akkermansiaceae bacterium]|nr:efflux transporter outer membrane subunit [Akkermansiaceae bacterium]